MKKYNKNEYVELNPSDLCGNGNAVARDSEGFVFFVKDGVPGDTVKARIIKVTKNYAVAIIDSFIKKSEIRNDSGCPYSVKCGGCVFQNISYESECEYKRKTINDNFERIAGLDITLSEFFSCDNVENYRNKAVYPVAEDKDGKMISGFYSRNSHRICEHDKCLIGNEKFTKIRDFVVDFCNANKISAYNEETHIGLVRHIYVRSAGDGTFVLSLIINGDKFVSLETELSFVGSLLEKFPECVSVLININKERGNGVIGEKWRKLFGDGYLYDTLLGKKFRIAPASFYQVNREQAELLYSRAGEYAEIKSGETVLDLYCGTGTIGICLAKPGCKLYGVEIVPEAVTDAKFNAKANNIDAEFICLDAGEALNSERIRSLSPDVIILDPPRKGCGEEAVKRIASFGAERIVYISCDPATLARDLKTFDSLGYYVKKSAGVDMFPRTGHCECCVLLYKR
ncbi:MAG: 23S rRNA (uracil(1939)-C(5))-methyltransferase RlmD [Clostridia bacterium]|nr:23S rRNA (uracil(1939)-C(5))-methyltransferase RlmD [Clostridia bacterium]